MSSSRKTDAQTRLLAAALYEVRLLLPHLVGTKESSAEALAAGIAYALHNDALSMLEGVPYDIEAALRRLRALDQRLGTNVLERLEHHMQTKLQLANVLDDGGIDWWVSWKFHLPTKQVADVDRVFSRVTSRCGVDWEATSKGLRGGRPGTWARVERRAWGPLGSVLVTTLDELTMFGSRCDISSPQRYESGLVEVDGWLAHCSHSELSAVEFALRNRQPGTPEDEATDQP